LDTLEFSQRLIRVLNDDEMQEVLKKAALQGFSVQGFKNPWKAPRPSIIKGMRYKKRGGQYYYLIILEAIANLSDLESSEISIQILADQWLNNDDIPHEIIENNLKILEEKRRNTSDENELVVKLESVATDDTFLEENHQLQKKNEELQDINKKFRFTIQGNKIEISDLRNNITKLENANEKLEKIIKQKQEEYNEYLKGYENLIIQIDEKDKYISTLIVQIEELKKYKECAPKILCFLKENTDDINFVGRDITYAKEWTDIQKESLASQEYDEIWIVHKGFTYSDITEIKASVSCTVKEFLSIARLKNKFGGKK